MWMEILYVPNIVTILRLVLVPFIVYHMYFENWEITFFICFVAVTSDFIDGAIARRLNMVSDLGRKLDPIADKILLLSVFFIIYHKKISPDWFALTVMAKDVLIPLIILVGRIKGVDLSFSPTIAGKATVVLQFVYIMLLVSERSLGIKPYHRFLVVPVVIFCVLSVISYVILILRSLAVRRWSFKL